MKEQKAILVATYNRLSSLEMCKEHLDELELLGKTYGFETVLKVPCPLKKIDVATFLSLGKIEEIKEMAIATQVDMVVLDDEISPAQQRNLEKILGKYVMDRTELILGVFAQRAQTKEAKLQIELAKTRYQYPRLKNLWSHLSRQTGGGSGGVFLKGEGEKQIELDKRLVREKIEKLQKEIEEVKLNRGVQRGSRKRSEIPIFAIVGYTNAGKSTLLNALTQSDVLVEDKLFATLDTTTRKFFLEKTQEVLLIDTVGFIRKLPHLLVASFKSTLEETMYADILLHVIDVSHPMAEAQAETTIKVLEELNTQEKPIITLLNKVDKENTSLMASKLRIKYPRTVQISAETRQGFQELEELMIQEMNKQRKEQLFRIPQKEYGVMTEIMRLGKIVKLDYEENDVLVKAVIPISLISRLKKYQIE